MQPLSTGGDLREPVRTELPAPLAVAAVGGDPCPQAQGGNLHQPGLFGELVNGGAEGVGERQVTRVDRYLSAAVGRPELDRGVPARTRDLPELREAVARLLEAQEDSGPLCTDGGWSPLQLGHVHLGCELRRPFERLVGTVAAAERAHECVRGERIRKHVGLAEQLGRLHRLGGVHGRRLNALDVRRCDRKVALNVDVQLEILGLGGSKPGAARGIPARGFVEQDSEPPQRLVLPETGECADAFEERASPDGVPREKAA